MGEQIKPDLIVNIKRDGLTAVYFTAKPDRKEPAK